MNTAEVNAARPFVGVGNTMALGRRLTVAVSGDRLTVVSPTSPAYRIVSGFINNALTRSIITANATNIYFHRASIMGIAMSAMHHSFNIQHDFPEGVRIYEQDHCGNAPNMRMGWVLPGNPRSANACGWVAAFNSFIDIDRFVHPADIIRFIEREGWLIAEGMFGVNPRAHQALFRRWFRDWGVTREYRVRTTFAERNLDGLARAARTAILCYFNPHPWGAPFGGAHYVTIRWDEAAGRYMMWNGPVNTFPSIGGFLDAPLPVGNRSFLSLTTID